MLTPEEKAKIFARYLETYARAATMHEAEPAPVSIATPEDFARLRIIDAIATHDARIAPIFPRTFDQFWTAALSLALPDPQQTPPQP